MQQQIICVIIQNKSGGWLPDSRPYVTLGTDGFGRSDSRAKLRSFFNVNAEHIVVATLKKLADEGDIDVRLVQDAINSFDIDADQAPAWQRQPQYDFFPDAPAPKATREPNPVPELVEDDNH